LAQEGAAREAGQNRTGHGEKRPALTYSFSWTIVAVAGATFGRHRVAARLRLVYREPHFQTS